MKQLFVLLTALFATQLNAQVSISNPASAPDASAMLDIKSTTKGLLLPRMTSVNRVLISNPAEGLMVFDTDIDRIYVYQNSNWFSFVVYE